MSVTCPCLRLSRQNVMSLFAGSMENAASSEDNLLLDAHLPIGIGWNSKDGVKRRTNLRRYHWVANIAETIAYALPTHGAP